MLNVMPVHFSEFPLGNSINEVEAPNVLGVLRCDPRGVVPFAAPRLSAVKEMANVLKRSHPLKILYAVVRLVAVLVVYLGKAFRVWDKGYPNQPMYWERPHLPILVKPHHLVPGGAEVGALPLPRSLVPGLYGATRPYSIPAVKSVYERGFHVPLLAYACKKTFRFGLGGMFRITHRSKQPRLTESEPMIANDDY